MKMIRDAFQLIQLRNRLKSQLRATNKKLEESTNHDDRMTLPLERADLQRRITDVNKTLSKQHRFLYLYQNTIEVLVSPLNISEGLATLIGVLLPVVPVVVALILSNMSNISKSHESENSDGIAIFFVVDMSDNMNHSIDQIGNTRALIAQQVVARTLSSYQFLNDRYAGILAIGGGQNGDMDACTRAVEEPIQQINSNVINTFTDFVDYRHVGGNTAYNYGLSNTINTLGDLASDYSEIQLFLMIGALEPSEDCEEIDDVYYEELLGELSELQAQNVSLNICVFAFLERETDDTLRLWLEDRGLDTTCRDRINVDQYEANESIERLVNISKRRIDSLIDGVQPPPLPTEAPFRIPSGADTSVPTSTSVSTLSPTLTPILTNTNTFCTLQNWSGRYTVEAGDTLSGIALSYQINVFDLAIGNCITPEASIVAGTVLRVPLPQTANPSSSITPSSSTTPPSTMTAMPSIISFIRIYQNGQLLREWVPNASPAPLSVQEARNIVVEAIVSDVRVGSVCFSYNSGTSRCENNGPYTHLENSGLQTFPPGNYSFFVTAWSESNGTGEQLGNYTINFTVQ